MEFFRGINVDWLGKKWYFLAFSLIFSVAGLLSMLFWHHIPLGVDFTGGTVIDIRFDQSPDLNRIRSSMDAAGLHDVRIQGFGAAEDHEILISLPLRETNEASLDRGRALIVDTLEKKYSATGADSAGKLDLDNASEQSITDLLTPVAGADGAKQAAAAITHFRDLDQVKSRTGLLPGIDSLSQVTSPANVNALKQGAYLSGFNVRNPQIVGPQVGAQLRKEALLATLYSLLGMLIYLWFRFELIYGVAAVVAVFHDTLITVGAFSLTNKEISLTVVAGILTLVGYSMNDTIVVFDRIRENLRTRRREGLSEVVNRSINQTMSRTILTSGLTFLTVLSLFLFGGEVLHPFSFALVIGILIGTYSSIAVAAPMLVAYQDYRAAKGKAAALPAGKRARA